MQHDASIVPIDDVAAQGNNIGDAGMRALRPALEKLTSVTVLNLSRTCGYVRVSGVGPGKEQVKRSW